MEKIDLSLKHLIKKACPAHITVHFNNDNSAATFTNTDGDTAQISAYVMRRTTTPALMALVQTEIQQNHFAKYAIASGLTLK